MHYLPSLLITVGNLVVEKPPPPAQPSGLMVGGPPISPGQGHSSKHPGQINLAQLRLQHMHQAAYTQQKQQQQQQQHQQQIQQQMRIASHLSQQHPRQAGPPMVQQQVLKRRTCFNNRTTSDILRHNIVSCCALTCI